MVTSPQVPGNGGYGNIKINESKRGQSQVMTQIHFFTWCSRLATCVHVPICSRWAIHFNVIVVSALSRRAKCTSHKSLLAPCQILFIPCAPSFRIYLTPSEPVNTWD